MAIKMCSFCLERDHYVRNQTIVTCPKLLASKLLASKCSHCLKFGHTLNFCKEKTRQDYCASSPKLQPKNILPNPNPNPKKMSRYAILELLEVNDNELETSDNELETSDNELDKSDSELDKSDTEEESEELEDIDLTDDSEDLPPVSAIIWGKGFACTNKKKWSD